MLHVHRRQLRSSMHEPLKHAVRRRAARRLAAAVQELQLAYSKPRAAVLFWEAQAGNDRGSEDCWAAVGQQAAARWVEFVDDEGFGLYPDLPDLI